MTGLRETFDQIAAEAPAYGDLDRAIEQADRERRKRYGVTAGIAAAAAVLTVIAALAAVSGDPDATPPVSPGPTSVTPSPTALKSQSEQTWVDNPVAATAGHGWKVPDPLTAARDAWFPAVSEHLDPEGGHLEPVEGLFWGGQFERPGEGSIYSTYGRVGLVVDGSELDPFDGCRYLSQGPEPSNGTVSCSAEWFTAPAGERARVARWERRCGAYEGGGPAPAICGDYRVTVAVMRDDGLFGFVEVEGRGTPDFNPFRRAAMAALAADRRLTLPESAYAVPSNSAVEAVVVDHVPGFRPGVPDRYATQHPGYAQVWGKLGLLGLRVTVHPAGAEPTCGRSWLTACVARRVFGVDDSTTVFVGAWDEDDWADCCPRNSRATSRVLVYVGPRHTVTVWESLIVKENADPVSAELDQPLIDVVLDPRLQ